MENPAEGGGVGSACVMGRGAPRHSCGGLCHTTLKYFARRVRIWWRDSHIPPHRSGTSASTPTSPSAGPATVGALVVGAVAIPTFTLLLSVRRARRRWRVHQAPLERPHGEARRVHQVLSQPLRVVSQPPQHN